MNPIKGKLIPIKDHVLVSDMTFAEEVTASGLVIPSQNRKSGGIKPRWGKVYAVGPEQHDVKVDEWVLVEHGRWTRGMEIDNNGVTVTIRRIENSAILLVADEKPTDVMLGE